MTSKAIKNTLSTPVPQSEQEDTRQVKNNAGGFTFTVDDKARLTRFLILGTDGGTYYQREHDITKGNLNFIQDVIARDEQLVIDTVREISTQGRAYRNSPAIYVTAALFAYGKIKPQSLVTQVCRTSTHLFEFAEYIELLGGWGRSKKNAVGAWYTSKTADQLALQAVKYRQRNGWTHRDLLRLGHPRIGSAHGMGIGEFMLGKEYDGEYHRLIAGFKAAQEAKNVPDLMAVMDTFLDLPWEVYPTQFHKEPLFWKTLFLNGAIRGQALLRNITRYASLGLFNDMVFAREFANRLTDVVMIQRTRLHPFQYLLALGVYMNGSLDRKTGLLSKDWNTSPIIAKALDEGFYLAFKYVEPANKRTMIALDVSGSMGAQIAGIGISSAEVTAAMSMTIARTEPYYQIMGFAHNFLDLGINPSMSLSDIRRQVVMSNFGTTDCSVPMEYARKNKIAVDTFLIMTDNETWSGYIHPHIALQKYRQTMGIDARLIVAATTPTKFTIADPTDAGMLDICGADSNLPKLVTEFSAGRI